MSRMHFLSRLTSMLAVLFIGTSVANAAGEQGAVIRAKDKVAPALVHIKPVKEVFRRGQREEVLVTGSGFIISPDGIVVTNEHVAGKSDHVRCVLYDKEEVDADVVGVDPYTDIAVLKLRVDRNDLPTVELGDSSKLEAGQAVLALGSPHGLARSVSKGIVSVTDRYLEDSGEAISLYNNWIQTDAAINPGNSGGPLVDLKGRVIGINTRRLNFADNVGFAIPVNIAREVIDAILANGKVVRSSVGIEFQEMTRTTEATDRPGVVIADVDPLSPGFRAGIHPGDILLAVNGQSTNARFVEDLPAVRKVIADLAVGQEAKLSIQRGDQTSDVAVVTEEKRKQAGEEVEYAGWGFSGSELSGQSVRQAQLNSYDGVLVSGTQIGGIAARAGLQTGEIILKVDGDAVTDLASFKTIYDARVAAHTELVLLTVRRGPLTRYVLLKQTPESNAG
ncbi:MAG: trypsin-like peptidase domain-containing protein [Candidatus Hydrogenedentota bacterium]